MFNDPATTARLVEAAEATFISTQIQTIKKLPSFPDNTFTVQRLGAGIVATTKPEFVWKLNQVAGWGMGEPVSEQDIETIEDAFRRIECPCTGTPPAERYKVAWEYMAVHALDLAEWKMENAQAEYESAKNIDIEITRIPADDTQKKDLFITSAVSGFLASGRSPILLKVLAQAATRRPDTRLYIARIDGEVAGTAALAFFSTPFGRVAELYLDSTLPAYQGRGVQSALLRARLDVAKSEGCGTAVVTARPGSGSARNAVRVGFGLVYTRETFTKTVTTSL